jgi:WD40 repeat protein
MSACNTQQGDNKSQELFPQTLDPPQPAAFLEFPAQERLVISNLSFSPDSKFVVACGGKEPGRIYIWSVDTRKLVSTLALPSRAYVARFSPDSKLLAAGGEDCMLYLWNTDNWSRIGAFPNEPRKEVILYMNWFPSGKQLLTAGWDRGPVLWDVDNHRPEMLSDDKSHICRISVSPDGKRFAVCYSKKIVFWDAKVKKGVATLAFEKDMHNVLYNPIGGTFATAAYLPDINIWDVESLKKLHECVGSTDQPDAIAFSPDGKLLVSCTGADDDGAATVCVWQVSTGKLVLSFSPSKHGSHYMSISPDGRWMAVTLLDYRTIQLWDFLDIQKRCKTLMEIGLFQPGRHGKFAETVN